MYILLNVKFVALKQFLKAKKYLTSTLFNIMRNIGYYSELAWQRHSNTPDGDETEVSSGIPLTTQKKLRAFKQSHPHVQSISLYVAV